MSPFFLHLPFEGSLMSIFNKSIGMALASALVVTTAPAIASAEPLDTGVKPRATESRSSASGPVIPAAVAVFNPYWLLKREADDVVRKVKEANPEATDIATPEGTGKVTFMLGGKKHELKITDFALYKDHTATGQREPELPTFTNGGNNIAEKPTEMHLFRGATGRDVKHTVKLQNFQAKFSEGDTSAATACTNAPTKAMESQKTKSGLCVFANNITVVKRKENDATPDVKVQGLPKGLSMSFVGDTLDGNRKDVKPADAKPYMAVDYAITGSIDLDAKLGKNVVTYSVSRATNPADMRVGTMNLHVYPLEDKYEPTVNTELNSQQKPLDISSLGDLTAQKISPLVSFSVKKSPTAQEWSAGQSLPDGATFVVDPAQKLEPGTTQKVSVQVVYKDNQGGDSVDTFDLWVRTPGVLGDIADSTVVEHAPVKPIAVTGKNLESHPTFHTVVGRGMPRAGLPEGLTYNPETREITGTPAVTWEKDEETKEFKVEAKVSRPGGTEEFKYFTITVQRDSDRDGEPDLSDKDDDGDGFSDEVEKHGGTDSKSEKSQPMSVVKPVKSLEPIENQTKVEGKAIEAVAIKAEDPKATITVDGLDGTGLTFDEASRTITGTPAVTWDGAEETHAITVKVTAVNEDGSSVTTNFTVTVARDTDKDGEPDTTDTDDDGDSFTDAVENAVGTDPKNRDEFPATPLNPGAQADVTGNGQTVYEYQPFHDIVVTPRDCATVTIDTASLPEGLTFAPATNSISGTPQVKWANGKEEQRLIIEATVTTPAGAKTTKLITIDVLRDTDKDGEPDTTDTDDDGDGYTDITETAEGTDPKGKDEFPAMLLVPTKPQIIPGEGVDRILANGVPVALDDVIRNPREGLTGTLLDVAGNPVAGASVQVDPKTGAITVTIDQGARAGAATIVIIAKDGTTIGEIPVRIEPAQVHVPETDNSKCVAAGVGLGIPFLALIPFALGASINLPGLAQRQAEFSRSIADAHRMLQQRAGIYNPDVAAWVEQANATLGSPQVQRGMRFAGLIAYAIIAGVTIADQCMPNDA